MKNNLLKLSVSAVAVVLVLASCSRDNSVASNHGIQKRKYTGGFHIDWNKKYKSTKESKNEKPEIAYNEEIETIPASVVETKSAKNIAHPEKTFATNESIQRVTVDENQPVKTLFTPSRKSAEKLNEQPTSTRGIKDEKTEATNNFTALKKMAKAAKKEHKNNGGIDPIVYILLCIFIPFVAVGLATDWNMKDVLINILLCCLCGIPGIIHAFIVCNREGVI